MKRDILGLLFTYETMTPRLEDVARDLFDDDHTTMLRKARKRQYPFPVFRAGNQKSPYLVHVDDIAKYIGQLHNDEKKNFNARRAS